MENRSRKTVAVLMVAGLMTAGPLAYAEYGGGPEAGKGYKRGEGKAFFKELNLTSEQKEQLKVQREARRKENQATRDQVKSKMKALHEEIAKPGTTRADVNGLVGEVNDLKGQMFSQTIDGLFIVKEVLTPEQFATMQAKHKERMDKKHEGWGNKRQRGPGKAGPKLGQE